MKSMIENQNSPVASPGCRGFPFLYYQPSILCRKTPRVHELDKARLHNLEYWVSPLCVLSGPRHVNQAGSYLRDDAPMEAILFA